jgi:CheY-like chemotaxis protein
VVDDNENAASMLKEALEQGYRVETATDGPTALGLARAFEPHIAVLDIGLPVMDGYELAQRLRQTPGANRLRLVAVTGYGQSDDRLRSRETGFDAHLVKPIALHQLQEVFSLLGGRSGPVR